MVKRKKRTRKALVYKTLDVKLQIEQHGPLAKWMGVNSCVSEEIDVTNCNLEKTS